MSSFISCCRNDGLDCQEVTTPECPTDYFELASPGKFCGLEDVCIGLGGLSFLNACCGPGGKCQQANSTTDFGAFTCPGGLAQGWHQQPGKACVPGLCDRYRAVCCGPNGECTAVDENAVDLIFACPANYDQITNQTGNGVTCQDSPCGTGACYFAPGAASAQAECVPDVSYEECFGAELFPGQAFGDVFRLGEDCAQRGACCRPEAGAAITVCPPDDDNTFELFCEDGVFFPGEQGNCDNACRQVFGGACIIPSRNECIENRSTGECSDWGVILGIPGLPTVFLLGEPCPDLGACCRTDGQSPTCEDTFEVLCTGSESECKCGDTNVFFVEGQTCPSTPWDADVCATTTDNPTKAPTDNPTKTPTETPTTAPTKAPTNVPTKSPTDNPTMAPTKAPTDNPTKTPTDSPTDNPTETPTKAPTDNPTAGCAETFVWDDDFCGSDPFARWKDAGGDSAGVRRRQDSSKTCGSNSNQGEPIQPSGTGFTDGPYPTGLNGCNACAIQIKGEPKNKLVTIEIPLGGCVNTIQVYMEFFIEDFESNDEFYFDYTYNRDGGWASKERLTFSDFPRNNEAYRSSIVIDTQANNGGSIWLRFFMDTGRTSDKLHIGRVIVEGKELLQDDVLRRINEAYENSGTFSPKLEQQQPTKLLASSWEVSPLTFCATVFAAVLVGLLVGRWTVGPKPQYERVAQ